ncbi:MAG: site-2 protease family protein [Actinomycetota bacterium]|nr:site-2 protease family protein [Actinomycetota bacterium]MDQ2957652.1 site-2 protease family protein [Actinomycetota bacterium]
MLYALGVIAFAVGLLASIALHEIGHLVPAKKFGVRVTQYMVGFGPTIWSKRRGETEYGIKAVPLGGYIRMIGMVPPRKDGKKSRWPRRMGTLVEEFRATSRTEVLDSDGDRQFYRLTPGKKMIVMLGGPTMNLLIFFLITILLYGIIGLRTPTTTVGSVSECVVPSTATSVTCPAKTSADYRKAPANGVLLAGDKINSINGVQVKTWNDAVTIIEASANKPLTVDVKRNGQNVALNITPVQNTKYANDAGTKTKLAGFIGISTTQTYQALSAGQLRSVIWQQLSLSVDALKQFPAKIGSLVGTVFEGKPRDQSGAVGVVGLGRIGGEIADSSKVAALDKISLLLSLLASVNLLLFFFNLLPLLPLDGGHVAGAIVEAVRRGFARLRKRPRLIFVDVAQLVPVMYVVASVLIVFSVLVMYADIVKPISLPQ